MEKFVINGGNALCGTVDISGAKNAAVAIIPATILIEDECIIENVPDIQDVRIILDILSSLGAKVEKINANTVKIDASTLNTYIAEKEMASKMRASYYLLGALCGRFKKAVVPPPGGCNFGIRPIDQHIKGFEALNCKVEIKHGSINVDGENIKGGQVYFDVVSVGATINLMLAAVRAPGVTVMENAAKEPHIVDVANFLNSMGADVRGAGTDVIKIRGGKPLVGRSYAIIPDQIEAGTYMAAVAAAGGSVLIKNVIL